MPSVADDYGAIFGFILSARDDPDLFWEKVIKGTEPDPVLQGYHNQLWTLLETFPAPPPPAASPTTRLTPLTGGVRGCVSTIDLQGQSMKAFMDSPINNPKRAELDAFISGLFHAQALIDILNYVKHGIPNPLPREDKKH